jgi:uncharacterized protein YndB with AHSA1/START domain
MTTITADDTVLRIERLIVATPEHLFGLWTRPDQFAKWFGPEGYEIRNHSLDVRPGGKWRATMRSTDGSKITVSGAYRTIDPPHKLVFTWAWDDDKGVRGHETEVTVTFAAAPGGTRLTLVQQRFETADGRNKHNMGWTSTLDKLARLVI